MRQRELIDYCTYSTNGCDVCPYNAECDVYLDIYGTTPVYEKIYHPERYTDKELPTIQPVATDTNVGDAISRKGVFIPNITVEMFRNASLVGVEDLMASGEMEDISLPSAQPEQRWIPCSERLPKPGYCITSNEYNGVSEDFYYDGHFWNADKNAYEVIAWMPLPEPYQGKERRTDE